MSEQRPARARSDSAALLRRFDLNLLIVFEALMTECHVTRAAKKVHLSQPAVSHALNRMREELGDPLLVRTDKGMQPTPRALEMLPAVQQALKLLEATLSPPQPFDPSVSERRFVIAATDYFELVLYPQLIARIREEAPGVSIEIQLISDEQLHSGLENRTVDLVVGLDSGHELPARLVAEPWMVDELTCLVGRDNSDVGEQLTPAQFAAQPRVVLTDVAGTTPLAHASRPDLSASEARTLSCNLSYMAAARIVAVSDAIMMLPARMADLFTQMLPVRRVTPPTGLEPLAMQIVTHPLYMQDPAIIWLKAQVHRCAREA